MLNDFEYLNLAQILRVNSLEFFVTIKEQVHHDLVSVFYLNLSYKENVIHSRVKNVDIDVSLEGIGRILHLSCEGTDTILTSMILSILMVRLLSPLPDYSMMKIIQPW